jgi:hypothetical protein
MGVALGVAVAVAFMFVASHMSIKEKTIFGTKHKILFLHSWE